MQWLTNTATFIAFIYLFFLTTWIFYLAIMNLKRNRSEITFVAKLFAYPTVVVGWLWDCVFNIVVGTILFLELPRELLFSERCERHLKDDSWRGREARFWCRNLLDPFDPSGIHCKSSGNEDW
jgi:hypothetical protein